MINIYNILYENNGSLGLLFSVSQIFTALNIYLPINSLETLSIIQNHRN